MNRAEKAALLKVHSALYLRPDYLLRLLDIFGGAENLLRASPRDLCAQAQMPLEYAGEFLKKAASFDAEGEFEKAEKTGSEIIFFTDPRYPRKLREINDFPAVLYVKGNPESEYALAVVGSRKPSNYGVRTCVSLIRKLEGLPLSVISGMARGIDAAAHESAVKNGIKTSAVLGCGLDICYPRENRKIYDAIPENGALISEFPFSTPPLAMHFPRRNRIISGLSDAVLVVEGGFASGSLITARFGLEQGKEILALPGNIDNPMSRGPNELIRKGAVPCLSALDIVSSLPMDFSLSFGKTTAEEPETPEITGLEREIWLYIKETADGATLDDIVHEFSIDVPRAAAAAFELETSGHIMKSGGKYRLSV